MYILYAIPPIMLIIILSGGYFLLVIPALMMLRILVNLHRLLRVRIITESYKKWLSDETATQIFDVAHHSDRLINIAGLRSELIWDEGVYDFFADFPSRNEDLIEPCLFILSQCRFVLRTEYLTPYSHDDGSYSF